MEKPKKSIILKLLRQKELEYVRINNLIGAYFGVYGFSKILKTLPKEYSIKPKDKGRFLVVTKLDEPDTTFCVCICPYSTNLNCTMQLAKHLGITNITIQIKKDIWLVGSKEFFTKHKKLPIAILHYIMETIDE